MKQMRNCKMIQAVQNKTVYMWFYMLPYPTKIQHLLKINIFTSNNIRAHNLAPNNTAFARIYKDEVCGHCTENVFEVLSKFSCRIYCLMVICISFIRACYFNAYISCKVSFGPISCC